MVVPCRYSHGTGILGWHPGSVSLICAGRGHTFNKYPEISKMDQHDSAWVNRENTPINARKHPWSNKLFWILVHWIIMTTPKSNDHSLEPGGLATAPSSWEEEAFQVQMRLISFGSSAKMTMGLAILDGKITEKYCRNRRRIVAWPVWPKKKSLFFSAHL